MESEGERERKGGRRGRGEERPTGGAVVAAMPWPATTAVHRSRRVGKKGKQEGGGVGAKGNKKEAGGTLCMCGEGDGHRHWRPTDRGERGEERETRRVRGGARCGVWTEKG